MHALQILILCRPGRGGAARVGTVTSAVAGSACAGAAARGGGCLDPKPRPRSHWAPDSRAQHPGGPPRRPGSRRVVGAPPLRARCCWAACARCPSWPCRWRPPHPRLAPSRHARGRGTGAGPWAGAVLPRRGANRGPEGEWGDMPAPPALGVKRMLRRGKRRPQVPIPPQTGFAGSLSIKPLAAERAPRGRPPGAQARGRPWRAHGKQMCNSAGTMKSPKWSCCEPHWLLKHTLRQAVPRLLRH